MTISNTFYLTLIHYWYICNRSIFEVVYSLNLMWVKVGESVEKGGKSPRAKNLNYHQRSYYRHLCLFDK